MQFDLSQDRKPGWADALERTPRSTGNGRHAPDPSGRLKLP